MKTVKDLVEENKNGFVLVCRPLYEEFPDESTITQWIRANTLSIGFGLHLFRHDFGDDIGIKSGFVITDKVGHVSPIDVLQDRGLRRVLVILDPEEVADRGAFEVKLPAYGTVFYGRAIQGYQSPVKEFYDAHAVVR